MKKLYLVFILAVAISCQMDQADSGNLKSDIESRAELEGNIIFNELYTAVAVKKVDSLLIVNTFSDPYIHIFNDDKVHAASLGRQGRGPGEFMNPVFIYNTESFESESYAYIWNRPSRTLYRMAINESLNAGRAELKEVVQVPSELEGISNIGGINRIDDERFVGVYDDRFYQRLDEKRGIFLYNRNSGNIETFPLLNLSIEPYDLMAEVNLNARGAVLSPNRLKLAVAMVHAPVIEIFNVEESTVHRVYLDDDPTLSGFSLEEYQKGNLIQYIDDLSASGNHIYLLWNGTPESEPAPRKKILKLDWNGKVVDHYIVSGEYDLNVIEADETNLYLYGVSFENDAIYQFKLPSHLIHK